MTQYSKLEDYCFEILIFIFHIYFEEWKAIIS